MAENEQNGRRNKKLVILVLVCIFAALASIRAINKCSTQAETIDGEGVRENWPVNIINLKTTTFIEKIVSNGILSSLEQASLSCEVAAKVKTIRADLGDRVEKGKVLIGLDGSAYYLNLEAAKAQLAEARATAKFHNETYARKQTLAKAGHISKEELEQAEAAAKSGKAVVRTAKANLNIARRNMGETSIRAPFTGRISSRNVGPGEMVSPGVVLITVEMDHVMKVDLALSETEVKKVKAGMDVTIKIPAMPEKSFLGKITRIGVAADRSSGAFPVRVEIDNGDFELLSGMRANLEIELNKATDSIVLSRDIIVKKNGKDVVYIIGKDNKEGKAIAKEVPVIIANSSGQNMLISSGLKEGQQLIVVGQHSLKDNLPVVVIEVDGKPYKEPGKDSSTEDSNSPAPVNGSEKTKK